MQYFSLENAFFFLIGQKLQVQAIKPKVEKKENLFQSVKKAKISLSVFCKIFREINSYIFDVNCFTKNGLRVHKCKKLIFPHCTVEYENVDFCNL